MPCRTPQILGQTGSVRLLVFVRGPEVSSSGERDAGQGSERSRRPPGHAERSLTLTCPRTQVRRYGDCCTQSSTPQSKGEELRGHAGMAPRARPGVPAASHLGIRKGDQSKSTPVEFFLNTLEQVEYRLRLAWSQCSSGTGRDFGSVYGDQGETVRGHP